MSQEYNKAQIQKFMQEYQGKLVPDMWGNYPGQCVSLVKRWLAFNHWPYLHGNAITWQYNGDGKQYQFYPRHIWTVPLVGDMAIFRVGPYGHIGIVVNASLSSMVVFNQNWPTGNATDPAKMTTFNYVHPQCIGFLRKL